MPVAEVSDWFAYFKSLPIAERYAHDGLSVQGTLVKKGERKKGFYIANVDGDCPKGYVPIEYRSPDQELPNLHGKVRVDLKGNSYVVAGLATRLFEHAKQQGYSPANKATEVLVIGDSGLVDALWLFEIAVHASNGSRMIDQIKKLQDERR